MSRGGIVGYGWSGGLMRAFLRVCVLAVVVFVGSALMETIFGWDMIATARAVSGPVKDAIEAAWPRLQEGIRHDTGTLPGGSG